MLTSILALFCYPSIYLEHMLFDFFLSSHSCILWAQSVSAGLLLSLPVRCHNSFFDRFVLPLWRLERQRQDSEHAVHQRTTASLCLFVYKHNILEFLKLEYAKCARHVTCVQCKACVESVYTCLQLISRSVSSCVKVVFYFTTYLKMYVIFFCARDHIIFPHDNTWKAFGC